MTFRTFILLETTAARQHFFRLKIDNDSFSIVDIGNGDHFEYIFFFFSFIFRQIFDIFILLPVANISPFRHAFAAKVEVINMRCI